MDLPSPPNLLALLEMCFRHAATFTLETMKQIYANIVILAFFFFFGFYSATHHPLRVYNFALATLEIISRCREWNITIALLYGSLCLC